MNSEGKIPLAYISNTPEYKAVAFYRNLEQVSKIYLLKEKLKENTEFILSKFPPLVNLTTRLSRIEALILTQKYDEAIQVTETLFNLLLKGIAYYQRYDWLFLRSIVSFGYLSWIVYSTVSVYKQYFSAEKDAGISLVSFIYLEP
jgi:phosphatidylinositol glycan class N